MFGYCKDSKTKFTFRNVLGLSYRSMYDIYCLYSLSKEIIFLSKVHHSPWKYCIKKDLCKKSVNTIICKMFFYFFLFTFRLNYWTVKKWIYVVSNLRIVCVWWLQLVAMVGMWSYYYVMGFYFCNLEREWKIMHEE